jgi:hypothetical protein
VTKTHRMHGTPTYRTWRAMKSRCLNPNDPAYLRYGGRGITVCDDWLQFEKFVGDMGVRPDGTELDRVDNDAGYSPDNCRWATRSQNSRNKRKTLRAPDGTPIAQLAEQHGIRYDTLMWRLKNGVPLDQALSCPPKTTNRFKEARSADA